MRIGIDAQFLGPKDKGLGVYTENLIKNLKKIDKENQYFILEYRGLKRHLVMPFKIKRLNLDLVHFTYSNVPILYRGKFVVTIHDLVFSHISFFKRLVYKIILKSALKRADKIIAVSEYTKRDILKHYPTKKGAGAINLDKIKVIYEGIR